MLGCYRKGDAADPEIYTRAVMAVLGRYPAAVVLAVTQPETGLPAKLNWLPTIAEVRQACESEIYPVRARLAREQRTAEQLAERDKIERQRAAREPEPAPASTGIPVDAGDLHLTPAQRRKKYWDR